MLREVKQFLQMHKSTTIVGLSQQLRIDKNILKDMLQQFIRKGWVQKAKAIASCQKPCQKCAPATYEIYEWIG
jgi:putative ferrous iron transport protein C